MSFLEQTKHKAVPHPSPEERAATGKAARNETIRLMELVGIPDAPRRFDNFPHEFSGGQNQRLMIAMALAGNPDRLDSGEGKRLLR